MSKSLTQYLSLNSIRCAPNEGEANVFFFGVRKGPDANADTLKAAILNHKGEFCEVNIFDGNEHSYIELGGWIGDQGAALTLMGLGEVLGLWELLTPKSLFGKFITPELEQQMAGNGMVAIRAIGLGAGHG